MRSRWRVRSRKSGASLSASAGWDSTSVGVAGLSEDADRLFDVLADVVRRPRFDAGEVARARAEQLASFEQEKDEPQALAGKRLARVLYGGHRYGVSADGEPASVAKLDVRALRAFHARLFTPEQSIVFVVGDVTAAHRARAGACPLRRVAGRGGARAGQPAARSGARVAPRRGRRPAGPRAGGDSRSATRASRAATPSASRPT